MTEAQWSVPETEVLSTARELLEGETDGVLATIIDVEGSAYRRPGAKMVIPEDGEGIGHITAGCLEDEVQRLSKSVLEAGLPRVETYDLRPEEDDDVWGLGVGCNGILDILLEPIDESFAPALDAIDGGRDIGVLTIIDAADESIIGGRAYYDPVDDAYSIGDSFPDDLIDRVHAATIELTNRGRADSIDVDDVRIFIDGIRGPDDLVVVGTGHDVGPIVELGKLADFRVTVVGFRGAAARSDRFPNADAVVSTTPTRIRDVFDFDEDTYVIVATHNFLDDRLAIDHLIGTETPYIGLMGPRERFETMLEEFEDEDRSFSDAEIEKIFTPIGLDLGGGSPYQIATSIVSEVLAVRHERRPRHLQDRKGPIHRRIDVG